MGRDTNEAGQGDDKLGFVNRNHGFAIQLNDIFLLFPHCWLISWLPFLPSNTYSFSLSISNLLPPAFFAAKFFPLHFNTNRAPRHVPLTPTPGFPGIHSTAGAFSPEAKRQSISFKFGVTWLPTMMWRAGKVVHGSRECIHGHTPCVYIYIYILIIKKKFKFIKIKKYF